MALKPTIQRDDAAKISELMNKTASYDMFITQIEREQSESAPVLMKDPQGNVHAIIAPDDAVLLRKAQLDVLMGLRSRSNAALSDLGVGPALSPKQADVKAAADKRKAK